MKLVLIWLLALIPVLEWWCPIFRNHSLSLTRKLSPSELILKLWNSIPRNNKASFFIFLFCVVTLDAQG
ncbi:hypothetical protein NMG60_11031573 [Bertholletia excelsa]